jgi:hypothetical protein
LAFTSTTADALFGVRGGVHDSRDVAGACSDRSHDLGHRRPVGDIGASGADRGSGRPHPLDRLDSAARQGIGAAGCQERGPVSVSGHRAAADEDERCPSSADGDLLGDGEADSAETAGDQVDTARLPGRARCRGQADRVEAADPALTAPVHDQFLDWVAGELLQQTSDQHLFLARRGPGRVDVDCHRGDVSELAGDHAADAVQQGPLRVELFRAEGVHAARDDTEADGMGLGRQCLGEEQKAGVLAFDKGIEGHRGVRVETEGHPRPRRPDGDQVHDPVGHRVPPLQRVDEIGPIAVARGIHDILRARERLEAVSEGH